MNVLYICKISILGNVVSKIEIPEKIAINFFNILASTIEDKDSVSLNVCHINNITSFEAIKIQIDKDIYWSDSLNTLLTTNGDNLEDGDLLVFERIGRSFCVRCVTTHNNKYLALIELFEETEKHMLLSATLNSYIKNDTRIPENYLKYLIAIRTKPFLLLAGISGTGKSRIVRELAFKSCPKYLQDKDKTTPGNYCMVEVKPNWHDSTELLGYYSNLSKGYQFKTFVQFLIKAKMFPNIPFFICLDEMNLAPVEQYFAEILSVLETRKRVETTKGIVIKTGVIIEAKYFQGLGELASTSFNQNFTDRDIYMKLFGISIESDIDPEVGHKKELTTEGLTLPDNVIIIGTVNMDDTTHQFSRKVIDRAMTIEMNGGYLRDMFGGSKNLEYLNEEEQKKWQNAFRQKYVTADEVLEAHSIDTARIVETLPTRIEDINRALKGTPFEVSYRVLNELTVMVGVMLDEQKDDETFDEIVNRAIDRILLMKILPRIEGDSDMFNLKTPVMINGVSCKNRLEWLRELAPTVEFRKGMDEQEDTEDVKTDSRLATETTKTLRQQTAKEKIVEMIERLENQEFTRFWP